MGVDKLGVDEMGIYRTNQIVTFKIPRCSKASVAKAGVVYRFLNCEDSTPVCETGMDATKIGGWV